MRRKKGRTVYLHREILSAKSGQHVDHISGDGLDNRKINLRLLTPSENHRAFRRKKAGASSRFRGVCWNKRDQKWSVYIMKDRRNYGLGSFENEQDAALAYDQKARELGFFREALNFPDEY